MNYYNENDPFAASWLRALIEDKQIPKGHVDERSIKEVTAKDLEGFAQHHFFAGIGGWSLALKLAGWPEDRPVWTGSCPCQGHSVAGKQQAKKDPRHLWPAFFRLIRECRPSVVFGEQVANAIRHGWLDDLCNDLEREAYAVGAHVLPACGIDKDHIRQRLWWVAYDARNRRRKERPNARGSIARNQTQGRSTGLVPSGAGRGLADMHGRVLDAECERREWRQGAPQGGLVDRPSSFGKEGYDGFICADETRVFIACADKKARRVPADAQGRPEPALFPLVDAGTVRKRVGLLRGAGNAIVAELAAKFILASEEAQG